MKTLLVTLLVASLAVACTQHVPTARNAADATATRTVVLISLDGFAAHYFDDPKADIPTLRALARQGARAASMKVSAPSVTWTNHTTLVTGVEPAKHGVYGNNCFDRSLNKRLTLIGDVDLDSRMIRTPTIYDLAHSAGMTTAGVRWPATTNAKSLDWLVADAAYDQKRIDQFTTPALLAECKEKGMWYTQVTEADGTMSDRTRDEVSTRILIQLLHERRPRLSLLHLVDTDHTQHLVGPNAPEIYDVIARTDRLVKQVWDALQTEFPGTATLVIASDHGFSRIEHAIFPNVILRDAGLLDVKGPRVVGGQVTLVPQGGSALLYVKDPAQRDAVVAKVKRAFAGVTGVANVVGPDGLASYGIGDATKDPRAPDMLLFADDGYVFGDTAAGTMTFAEKPERKGSHGHDPALPNLHGIFLAAGNGIRPGTTLGEIQNTTVAPTIAALLGLKIPDADGRPLEAALRK